MRPLYRKSGEFRPALEVYGLYLFLMYSLRNYDGVWGPPT